MGQNAKYKFILIALLVLACTASSSFAQEMTDGIRFGAFAIHPSLYTAMRYIDNVYFVPDNYQPENERSVPQTIESDMVLNVTPALMLSLDVPTFKARTGYRFYNDTYLGTDDPENRHDDLNASNHTFNGLLDYSAPVGLLLGASDTYAILETYEDSQQFQDFVRGNQIHNDARGWLGFRSGPYDNIYTKVTYTNLIDQYKEFNDYDKMGQYVDGSFALKFFPRTAFVVEGGYGMVDYDRIQAFDSTSWYAMGGVQGQITNHLMTVLKGGWVMADYQENDDLANWLANAELTAMFSSQTRLTVGYRHFWRDAADTNYYTGHEGYLGFSRLWGSRLLTSAYGSYQYNDFSEPLARHEDFIQASADINYRFVYWLYFGGGYKFEQRIYDDDIVRETSSRNVGIIHLQAQF